MKKTTWPSLCIILLCTLVFVSASADTLALVHSYFKSSVAKSFTVGKVKEDVNSLASNPTHVTLTNTFTIQNKKAKENVSTAVVTNKEKLTTSDLFDGKWKIGLQIPNAKGKGNDYGGQLVNELIKNDYDAMFTAGSHYSLLPLFVQYFHPTLSTEEAGEIVKAALLKAQKAGYPTEWVTVEYITYGEDMKYREFPDADSYINAVDYVVFGRREYFVCSYADGFTLVSYPTSKADNISFTAQAAEEEKEEVASDMPLASGNPETPAVSSAPSSDMNFNELIALHQQIGLQIMQAPEFKEVHVPAGAWTVGVDIPAGTYRITSEGGEFGLFENADAYQNDKFKLLQYVMADSEIGRVEVVDGNVIRLQQKGVTFHTFIGLGF